jgi:hypothetical protein
MLRGHDEARSDQSAKEGPGMRKRTALWLHAGDARLAAWGRMSEDERRAMRVAVRRMALEELHEHERGAMFE